jgi:transcription initiation factor TFIID subunit 5
MDEKQIDAIVFNYLKARGYANAAGQLKQESKIQTIEDLASQLRAESDISLPNIIMFHNKQENTPKRYDESYTALRNWVFSSLDMYKAELLSVLYPIFVHCYLDLVEKGHSEEARQFMAAHKEDHEDKYGNEINRLQAITTVDHMKENELANLFRNNKFNLKMCNYSFELLLSYLHEMKFMMILSIVNQYLNITVFAGQPQQMPEIEFKAISGYTEETIRSLHKKAIYWGLFEEQKRLQTLPDPEEADENDAEEGDAMDVEEAGKEGKKKKKKETKKKKKDKKADGEEEEKDQKSVVPLPRVTDDMEQEIMNDLKTRVSISATNLPSVAFYTFFNTYGAMNTLALNQEGSLVATGHADSSIKVWDLSKDNSKWVKSTKDYFEADSRDNRYKNYRDRAYKEDDSAFQSDLIGHTGPVYGLDFSPEGQFLLSGGQDGTVRLWSLHTKTNLVSYNGHNYPVWNVKFSPLGFYFATTSYDRTARLYSTNQIWPLRIFAGHLSDVNVVDFHPNCNYIATGSSDKSVRFWDINTGMCVRVFTGHFGSIYSLGASPEGRMLASAGEDKDVLLWDIASGTKISTLRAHTNNVWSIKFSSEGNILASAGADETVCLWDIRNPSVPLDTQAIASLKPTLLGKYPTKKTPVYQVQFTRRNLLLAAGAFHTKDEK